MSVAPFLHRALRGGAVVAIAAALVGGGVGFALSGMPGLVGGLLGAVAAAAFLGITAVSILLAGRATRGDLTSPVFFAIVLGVWPVKLLVFLGLALWLREQPWLDIVVFAWTTIAAIVGSLVADAVAFQRSRIPLDLGGRSPS